MPLLHKPKESWNSLLALFMFFLFVVNKYETYKFVLLYQKNLELCLVWLQSVTKSVMAQLHFY